MYVKDMTALFSYGKGKKTERHQKRSDTHDFVV
jgi:hypothetical protein